MSFETLPLWVSHLLRLSAAFFLALPIGWNREQEHEGAGLRTFPIVSISCCGLILLGTQVFGQGSEAHSRILQGIFAGIGFLGGGAILKQEKSVHGTATAASIWNMAVVGASAGFGLYEIAIILVLVDFMTLRYLLPLKERCRGK